MFTFVVVAARPGCEIPADTRALLDDPAPAELAFRPVHHVSWSSVDGRVRLAAWQDADRLGIGHRWHIAPTGVTAFSGMPWHRATPWSNSSTWAAQLADLLVRIPLAEAVPDLDGQFIAASIDANGHGTISADPLGFESLYHSQGDDVVVASNRALLAARLSTSPGRPPARDLEAMGWLVFGGIVHDWRTGFAGVRRVPDGSFLDLAPDRPLELRTWARHPWWAGSPVGPEGCAAAIDDVAEAVIGQLRVQAELPSWLRTMELTGGHDSRVLLALVLRAGLQHHFTYRTWGDRELADVQVARRLAERYDLDHRDHDAARRGPHPSPQPGPVSADGSKVGVDPAAASDRTTPSPLDQALHHCWASSGGLSLWEQRVPAGPPSPNVSVSGLYGELLRARSPGAAGFEDLAAVVVALRAGWMHCDPGALLLPDVREHYVQRTTELAAECIGPGGTVQDGFDGFYIRHRLQPWRGMNAANDPTNRVFPYLTRSAIRAAFAVGPAARRDELTAFTLVDAIDPWLARQRFAGPGWPERLVRGRHDAADFHTSAVGARWKPTVEAATPARPPSIRQTYRQAAHDQAVAALVPLLDLPRGHVLFDLVDRRALMGSLRERPADGSPHRALYDVATAAIWLEGADKPA